MRPIKVTLGDLRHKTIGRHSVFTPLGISYVASYTLAHIDKKDIEIKLFDDVDIMLKDITAWRPDVVGLSNYCWNSELSRLVFRYAKKLNHSVVCIAGGPEFPVEKLESEKYLSVRPEIDFYVYFEGEVAFVYLMQKILKGREIKCLKSEPQSGVMSINPTSKKLVFGEPLPRFTNLDVIPSPYLSGLMDQWLNGNYAPSIETARGCPFSCGFCFAGQARFNSIATFSVQRIKDELSYIAKRMKGYPHILLSICDSNFGMYPRDEEIARHCRKLQDEYGWPNAFDVTTGKANYERILKIAALLKNRLQVTCSIQSLNPKTLKVIKRENLPIDRYRQIQTEIKKRGMISVAELITPMPEETKTSFFNGLRIVINAGVEHVVPYTTMLLKGTYLSSADCRKKYNMQTRFRILPRQFSEYMGEKCFEIEEVCVATNTMSFKGYLDIRGFALISSFFSSEQFDIIHRHLKELKISNYDFYYYLWELIKAGKTTLSTIYNGYIQETREELWDSKETLYNYFKKQNNYNRLLTGEKGDSLIRKYTIELLLESCTPAVELAYSTIKHITNNINKEALESLDAARRWMLTTRDLKTIFKNFANINVNKIMNFPYDITSWYRNASEPLVSYKRSVSYRIFYDSKKLNMILKQSRRLYGEDLSFMIAKLLINWSIKNFWCQCEELK